MKIWTAITILILTGLLPISIHGQEFKELNRDSIIYLVKKYYQVNKKIFTAHSTIDDINHVFSLFTDDFTYVHPKYGGTYSRNDLYDGYVRNQKNGAYNGDIIDIKVIKMIVGLNAIAVEKKFIKKGKNDERVEGDVEMTLFEFRDNKISKIFEYW